MPEKLSFLGDEEGLVHYERLINVKNVKGLDGRVG
jgi:hypothetical protein